MIVVVPEELKPQVPPAWNIASVVMMLIVSADLIPTCTLPSASIKEAVKLSAEVLESFAKEPSDKAITAPNQFAKQLKTEKNDRYNNLQKAFSTLKK